MRDFHRCKDGLWIGRVLRASIYHNGERAGTGQAAAEFIHLKVDVIVTPGGAVVRQSRRHRSSRLSSRRRWTRLETDSTSWRSANDCRRYTAIRSSSKRAV